MHVIMRNRWLSGLAVLLAGLVMWGGGALADITTNEPGTVLIFPKVIANGTRDTLIQITNTTNKLIGAHCTYRNALGTCHISSGISCKQVPLVGTGSSDCPPLATTPAQSGFCAGTGTPCASDAGCDPGVLCEGLAREACDGTCGQEIDFTILLTKQQPTVWRVSTGRDNPQEQLPALKGFEPGAVPPRVPPFEGTLRCVQIDPGDESITPGNALKGEAVLETIGNAACTGSGSPLTCCGGPGTGTCGNEISEYNAIAIKGVNSPTDGNLLLDNDPNNGGFNACPSQLWVNHVADGGSDPIVTPPIFTGSATVNTEITLVPCSEDLGTGVAMQSEANFNTYDDTEAHVISLQAFFDCYWNGTLTDLNGGASLAGFETDINKTTITPGAGTVCFSGSSPVGSTCDPNATNPCGSSADAVFGCHARPGLIGVMEEFRSSGSSTVVGTAAANLHNDGSTRPGDLIELENPSCGAIGFQCCCPGSMPCPPNLPSSCPLSGTCNASNGTCE